MPQIVVSIVGSVSAGRARRPDHVASGLVSQHTSAVALGLPQHRSTAAAHHLTVREGSVFRVVRRLGFGNKTLPNRISICASRRIRRYMIVLGFDDPRNSDLSTQRHNGRWPMAPWRQWHARVRRRRAAARARMKPARLSPAPYMPGPTPDVPWDPPTSAGRPARTELICLLMRTHRSLDKNT